MTEATPSGTPSSNRGVMIVLSYLWILALVPLLTEKEDEEVRWHAKHGIVLMVAEIAFWIVFTILTNIIIAMTTPPASSTSCHRVGAGVLPRSSCWPLSGGICRDRPPHSGRQPRQSPAFVCTNVSCRPSSAVQGSAAVLRPAAAATPRWSFGAMAC